MSQPATKTRSTATKRKISKANKGKKRTPEFKALLSEINTGKTHSEETKQKISENTLGKKRSTKTKARISKAKKGKPLSEKNLLNLREAICKKVKVIDSSGIETIYPSKKEAGIATGVCTGSIEKFCYGKITKNKQGYKFKYLE